MVNGGGSEGQQVMGRDATGGIRRSKALESFENRLF